MDEHLSGTPETEKKEFETVQVINFSELQKRDVIEIVFAGFNNRPARIRLTVKDVVVDGKKLGGKPIKKTSSYEDHIQVIGHTAQGEWYKDFTADIVDSSAEAQKDSPYYDQNYVPRIRRGGNFRFNRPYVLNENDYGLYEKGKKRKIGKSTGGGRIESLKIKRSAQ